MKKYLGHLVFVTFSILSIGALAIAPISLIKVNEKITQLLMPFNSKVSSMKIMFTNLNVDSTRALDFGVKASHWKIGPKNEVKLEIKKAEYHYGDGTSPKFDLVANLNVDFIKLVGQSTINEVSKNLNDMLMDMTSDYTKKYGNAIKIDSKVDSLTKDVNGDVKSVKVHFNGKIDFSKLPADLPITDVEFQKFHFEITFSSSSAAGNLSIRMNPKYRGFADDQDGMKEYIEKLLSEDKETYHDLKVIGSMLDSFSSSAVNNDSGSEDKL